MGHRAINVSAIFINQSFNHQVIVEGHHSSCLPVAFIFVFFWGGGASKQLVCRHEPSPAFHEYRPLAIRAAYSHEPILGVILGVKIVYKHAQKRVATQICAHGSEARSVLSKKSIAPLCITQSASGHWGHAHVFYAQRTAIDQWSASFLRVLCVVICNGSILNLLTPLLTNLIQDLELQRLLHVRRRVEPKAAIIGAGRKVIAGTKNNRVHLREAKPNKC